MSYKARSRKARAGVFATAAVTAASGLVGAGLRSASADLVPRSLRLSYQCRYPLIGWQDITTKVEATLQDEIAVLGDEETPGTNFPIFDITTETTIGAATTEGLNTMNAATLEGEASASVSVRTPQQRLNLTTTGITLEKTRIPGSGSFTVKATGRSPREFVSQKEGWGSIYVGFLALTVTPRDKQGNETALGTISVQCNPKPGQINTLHQFFVRGTGAKDDPPPRDAWESKPPGWADPKSKDYPEHRHSVTLKYRCRFPDIGDSTVSVNARLDYPEAVPVGYVTPRLSVSSVNFLDEGATRGLQMLDDPPAATVGGQALAWATITAPEVPAGKQLAVKLRLPVPKANVPPAPIPPAPTRPMQISAAGSTVALAFGTPGDAVIRVGNLDLDITPRSATGGLTQMGRIVTTCTQLPGQHNQLARIRVIHELDKVRPSAPGTPSVTGKTPTSVSLKWTASTDTVGIAGYDIYDRGKRVAGTYGDRASATVTGLPDDTGHTFTIKARDGSGNISPAGPPVSVRTPKGPDTERPTVPGKPKLTGNTETRVSLTWPRSTDRVGVTGYDVFRNGSFAVRVPGPNATLQGLRPGTSHNLKVRARDAAGNLSGFSPILTVRTKPDKKAPTVPTGLRAPQRTPRTVTLAWRPAADNVGVTGYDVFQNGRPIKRVAATSVVAIDLRPGTPYTFRVRARDWSGNVSGLSAPLTVRTTTGVFTSLGDSPFELFLDTITPGGDGVSGLTLVPRGDE